MTIRNSAALIMFALIAGFIAFAMLWEIKVAHGAPDGGVVAAQVDAGAKPAAAPVTSPAGSGSASSAIPATTPVALPADPTSAVSDIINDVRGHNYRMLVVALLALVMMVANKYRDSVSWFKGDRGGAILVILLAEAGAIATALASGASLTLGLFTGALMIGFTAAGGYTVIKRIIWPKPDAPKLAAIPPSK